MVIVLGGEAEVGLDDAGKGDVFGGVAAAVEGDDDGAAENSEGEGGENEAADAAMKITLCFISVA